MCHVIHIFFGSSLGKGQMNQVFLLQDMCDKFLGEKEPSCPFSIREQPRKGTSSIGLTFL